MNSTSICYGKVPFDSRELALQVVNRRSHGGAPRKAYRCPECRHWHIGSIDPIKSQRRGARPAR